VHFPPEPTPDEAIAATRRWLERAVIGLGLCPFARQPHLEGRIRFASSEARSEAALLLDLERELLALADPDTREETTLLIHPYVLGDFLVYNQFLDLAEALLAASGLEGVLQVASFHPGYQFAGSGPGDIENFTNRSPYPILHLLREESVAQAVDAFPDTDRIYERNIEVLRRLGHSGWNALWEK